MAIAKVPRAFVEAQMQEIGIPPADLDHMTYATRIQLLLACAKVIEAQRPITLNMTVYKDGAGPVLDPGAT